MTRHIESVNIIILLLSRDHWVVIIDLCISHLTNSQQQQQHSLKVSSLHLIIESDILCLVQLLEEICRASAELPQATLLWQRLLTGPLIMILQNTTPLRYASAGGVLATISNTTMNKLQVCCNV